MANFWIITGLCNEEDQGVHSLTQKSSTKVLRTNMFSSTSKDIGPSSTKVVAAASIA